jgi:hypothetical protein
MLFEVRCYYKNRENENSLIDKECSVNAREIADEQVEQFINLFEAMGMTRHETKSQIFYDTIIDARHSTEYIFYK